MIFVLQWHQDSAVMNLIQFQGVLSVDLQKAPLGIKQNITEQEMHKFITAESGCHCNTNITLYLTVDQFYTSILFIYFNAISSLYHVLPSYTIIFISYQMFLHM
jgi:hypothetical protein